MIHSNQPVRPATTLFVHLTLCLLGAVSPCGCTLQHTGAEEVNSVLRQHSSRGAPLAASYAGLPTRRPESTTAAAIETEQQPSSLKDFILLALEGNPEIKAAAAVARAKVERIAQVTALPDPFLATKTMVEPIRTAEGDSYFTLNLAQKLPVPEKLDRRGRIALAETRMALQTLNSVRLQMIADVKRAFFQLYAIDNSIDITNENKDLLTGLIDVARGQVAAGTRAQEDVLRAQVELSSLEAQLVRLRQRRVTTQATLNRVTNRPPDTPIEPPKDFAIRDVDHVVATLLERAVDLNPSLQHIQEQIERDSQALELARLAYWPDFTVGFEWQSLESRDAFRPPPNPVTGQRPVVSQLSEDGSDNWGITVGLNIPIWHQKIGAGIREAKQQLAASQQQYTAELNRVHSQITDALERVRAQQELALIFAHTIIPQAQQAYEVSRAGYAAGGSDFLYVIDNWQKWLQFRIQYHRVLGELERSVADLEQVLGMSISDAQESQ